ncbi:hypothetical protein AB0G04_40705 [Actinoplanes sp. NPDC023801]|uniref:hypothetical protein n=1 Tax=Actinoplanes sp. NPDC023801 TaxID=3154595 RepID=UPI0033FF4246
MTVVSPLLFASVLGVGGGYLTFIAAAIVAVAVSSEKKVRTALTLLTGMTGIAGGALMIAGMLRYPLLPGEPVVFWMIAGRGWLGGVIAIVFGGAVLARGDRLLRAMDAMMERPFALMRLTALGLFSVAGLISGLHDVHSVQDAAYGLPLVGFAVTTFGWSLLYALPPERVSRLRATWRDLTRPRGDEEPHPSYGS